MHMGSDATKYQCKTFMDINTMQRKLENRESHRNQCTFEQLRDLDPLPRAYHVFKWPSNGKKVHVNKQRCYTPRPSSVHRSLLDMFWEEM